MNLDRDTAKELIERFEEINKNIFSVLPDFEGRLLPEEFECLKREVARMGGGMADSNIYPALLKQYHDLNPLKD